MGLPIIGDIIDAVSDLAGKAIVDKDKKNELLFRLEELKDKADERLHTELMGQIEVNKVEAAHSSIFVAGWRPFIGWSCGVGFIYNTIIAPMFGLELTDLGFFQAVLFGMLGLGAMRSYDKTQGTATTKVKAK